MCGMQKYFFNNKTYLSRFQNLDVNVTILLTQFYSNTTVTKKIKIYLTF